MNILYWNVRGIGNSDTRLVLKIFYLFHNPILMFVAEPMINFHQVPAWYWPSIGVSKYCTNNRGPLMPNLWALWENELLASVIFVSDQCIALELSCFQSTVYIAAIYASNYYLKRRQLWADLTHHQGCFQGSWLFIGDFNAVLGVHEKRGRRPPPTLSGEDFLNWSNANILNHLPTTGSFSLGLMVDLVLKMWRSVLIGQFAMRLGLIFGATPLVQP